MSLRGSGQTHGERAERNMASTGTDEMIGNMDTTGWTAAEISAYGQYHAIVVALRDQPKLTFYDARLLIDAYAAWVEIFDPPRARYHVAFLRQQIVRREWGGTP